MLLQGKKALIMGLANNRSIAYGIAAALKEQGARLAFNYVGEAIKKRVEPLSEELGGEFTFQCDVCDDGQIADAAALVKDNWGDLDILVHSVAFVRISTAAFWIPRATASSWHWKFRPFRLPPSAAPSSLCCTTALRS